MISPFSESASGIKPENFVAKVISIDPRERGREKIALHTCAIVGHLLTAGVMILRVLCYRMDIIISTL